MYFHMDNHLDQVRGVMFVEIILRQNSTSEKTWAKIHLIFVVPSPRHQDIRPILPNPKFKIFLLHILFFFMFKVL